MKKYFLALSLLLLGSSCSTLLPNYIDLAGLSPYTHYKTFETEHFTFIYQDGYFDFTERAAAHIEHAHEILSPILKWQPRTKTTILVADNADSANGFTSPALRIGIVLIATPPEGWFSTSYSDDWIKLLVFHEYTHLLNIDPTRGFMEVARIFFGDVVRPNGLWPTWMLEGLAVYFETRTSKMGRGRSPYYDAILRAYLNENRLGTRENRGITLDRVSGDYPYFPSGEISYLFGYHLWDEFSKDHSLQTDTDSAMGDYSFHSSRRFPYLIEGNLQNVMGKHWKNYWTSFLEDSKTRLGKQIDAVKKIGETKYSPLTDAMYSSMLGAISPDGQWLAYSESSLDDQSRLVLINLKTFETRRLEEKSLGVGMSFTPDSKALIYSTLIRTRTYSLFSDLFAYDIEHDKTEHLSEGLRGKDPSLSPNGTQVVFTQSVKATDLLMVATLLHNNGKYELSGIKTLYTPAQFAILSTPRFLNDDEVVFSKQEIGQTQAELVVSKLSDGSSRPFYSDGGMIRHPYVSSGKVYFISDRSGIENVYSVDSDGKNPQSLTNVITSVAMPVMAPDGTLYGSVLTSDGYEIVKFKDIQPTALLEPVGNPSAPEALPEALKEPALKITEDQTKDYSPWSSLAPRQWAPVSLINYNSNSGLSMDGTLLGFDSTGKHQYFGYIGYNFKPQTVDGSFSYTYYGFRPVINLSASSVTTDIATDYNHAQYRNSSQVELNLSYPVAFTYSRLIPSIYGFVDWNRVYDLSTQAPLPTSDFEYSKPLIPGVGTQLSFSDAENTKLGFMPEAGNQFIVAAEDRVNVDQFSVIKYLALYTHYFDLTNHMVLQPRVKFLGTSYPTGFDVSYARVEGRDDTSIYDEGTGINLNQIEVRGYPYYPFLYTKETVVGSLDYHFPIAKPFVGAGNTAPFFLKQIHGFVFVEAAYLPYIYNSGDHDVYLPSFGGGITADTTLFYNAPLRVNLQIQNGTNSTYFGATSFFLSLEGGSLF